MRSHASPHTVAGSRSEPGPCAGNRCTPRKPTPGPATGADATAATLDAASLLALQRSAGNAAALRVLQRMRAAADTEPDDGGPGISTHGPADPAAAIRRVLHQPGHRLPAPVRRDMEARLGADFGSVRLHTGPAAESSATGVGARAYTSGEHIVLNRTAAADRRTLAHELVHVVQQRQGPVAGTDTGTGLAISDPGDRFERAAESTAARALAGPVPAGPRPPTGPGEEVHAGPVQRSADGRTPVQRGIVEEAVKADDESFLNTLAQLNPKAAGAHLWVTVGTTPLYQVQLPQWPRNESLWPIASEAGYHAEQKFIDNALPATWKTVKTKHYTFELNKTPCPDCTKAITKLPQDYPGIIVKTRSIGLYPGNLQQGGHSHPTTLEDLQALEGFRGWQSALLRLDAIHRRLAQGTLVEDRRVFDFLTGVVSAMIAAERTLKKNWRKTEYGRAVRQTKLKFQDLLDKLYPRTPALAEASDQPLPATPDSQAFSQLTLHDKKPEEELKVLAAEGGKIEEAKAAASQDIPPQLIHPGQTSRPQYYPRPDPQPLLDPSGFVLTAPPTVPVYMGSPPQMPMYPMSPTYYPLSHMGYPPPWFYPPVAFIPYGSVPYGGPQGPFPPHAFPTDVRWYPQGPPPERKRDDDEKTHQ